MKPLFAARSFSPSIKSFSKLVFFAFLLLAMVKGKAGAVPVTITSIIAGTPGPINTTALNFTVTFSVAVNGVGVSNFSLNATGNVSGTISGISGSGSAYIVSVTNLAGDGTLTLSLSDATGISQPISSPLPYTGAPIAIDHTAPQATSLYMSSNNLNYAAAVVGNTVTLIFGADEPIQTPAVTIGGHNIAAVSTGGNNYSASYTMTANDLPGRVHFLLVMTDAAGNSSSYNDLAAGDDVEFTLSSAVVSINLYNPAVAITSAKQVTYRASFSLPVSGVSASSFTLASTGTAGGTIGTITPVSGAVYDVTVKNVSGDGTLTLNLTNAAGITPVLTSALPFTGQTYTIDNTAPTFGIGNPSTYNTSNGPVTYTLYYSDLNFGAATLSAANITLNKTGTATGDVAVSGSGQVYTVTISNITGSGILSISIGMGTAYDKAGNIAAAVSSTPNFSVVSSTATLNNLSLSGGTPVTPGFDKTVTTYYASVPNTTSSVKLTPTLTDSHSTVMVNNTLVASGAASGDIALNVGNNQILTTVTAQDGVTKTIYTLYVVRTPSSIATLSGLNIDGGLSLTPAFASGIVGYDVSVPNAITTINVTPTATDATATLSLNGNAIISGAAIAVPLAIGLNTITAAVTAQDGITIKTYAIRATRARATSTISFLALPVKTYGDADFLPGATSNNANVPVTYISDNPAVATIVNGKIHITGAGTAGITASQAGDNNNNPANDVTWQLTVNKVAITVQTTATGKIFGQADPALAYKVTSGALIGNDMFSGALNRTAGEPAGVYLITAGSLTLSNNYTLTFFGANFTISKAAITVTVAAGTKTYGQADPAFTYTVTSGALIGTDAFTGSLSRNAGENAGVYPITQGSLSAGVNYDIIYVGAVLTIGKAAIAITALAQSKIYGEADPAFTYTIINGTLAANDTFTGKLTRDAGDITGVYAIKQGTLALSNNYTLTYTGAKLTVGLKTLTITAANKTKVYGSANPALTVSYDGFINGDNNTVFATQPVINTTALVTSPVNNYPITTSGAAAVNYKIVYVPGTLSITKAVLTITAADKSRPYGAANPPFTVTYNGFVNNDTEAVLTALPTATVSAPANKPPGKYAITVSGAATTNYSFIYVNGNLTITALSNAELLNLALSAGTLSPAFNKTTHSYRVSVDGAVKELSITPTLGDATATVSVNGSLAHSGSPSQVIPLVVGNNIISITVTAQDGVTKTEYSVVITRAAPISAVKPTNIITPNGDGKNDTWLVPDIQLFPDNYVSVFDRSGRQVYYKKGYTNDWDGSVNGSPLTEGTYYYTVNLGKGISTIVGYITILRNK